MEIERMSQPLVWPPMEPSPMPAIVHDWYGEPIEPPARYRLVEDPSHLWFIAGRQKPAKPHPAGDCGDFQAELWKHDVAELFIADSAHQGYVEFNLSPRGAWWAARFEGPRRVLALPALPEVLSESEMASGGWLAGLGIPLDWLAQTIDWNTRSPLNVSFILDSPQQRFLSACPLGEGEPDFHQPARFQPASQRP